MIKKPNFMQSQKRHGLMYVWTKLYHIEIIFRRRQIVLNSCWYNLYVNPADLFSDILTRPQDKMNGNQHLDWLRDAWFMAELENRLLQKQTNRSSQRSEGANMATWLTRGGSNQVRGRKKKYEHIGRFKLFLDRNQYLAQIFVYT